MSYFMCTMYLYVLCFLIALLLYSLFIKKMYIAHLKLSFDFFHCLKYFDLCTFQFRQNFCCLQSIYFHFSIPAPVGWHWDAIVGGFPPQVTRGGLSAALHGTAPGGEVGHDTPAGWHPRTHRRPARHTHTGIGVYSSSFIKISEKFPFLSYCLPSHVFFSSKIHVQAFLFTVESIS